MSWKMNGMIVGLRILKNQYTDLHAMNCWLDALYLDWPMSLIIQMICQVVKQKLTAIIAFVPKSSYIEIIFWLSLKPVCI